MKKILILLQILCSFSIVYAQKELWGTNVGDEYNDQTPLYEGNITKIDINGNNPLIMHEFEGATGKIPKGKLFQASNGKLYGITKHGGSIFNINSTISISAGVLFEYDLILNKYRVVHYFDFEPVVPNNSNSLAFNPEIGVLEPVLGKLYGATQNRIYSYDIITEQITFYNQLPFNNRFVFELMKASDGNLYGTSLDSYCLNQFSTGFQNGCILKFNMTTNNLSVVHPLSCGSVSEGSAPWTQLIETSPGKLLGGTLSYGADPTEECILFEYNFITNTYTKKISLKTATTGVTPTSLINGGNGKIYGLCVEGGAPQSCSPIYQDGSLPPHMFGTLFEYTPISNTLEIKEYFNYCNNFIRYPKSIIKTSEGYFIGSSQNFGYFKYDSNTNISTSIFTPLAPSNLTSNANFIEICRKPSYQEFLPNTYSPEVGSTFTYNINNINATNYVWKKGTTILLAQTTGTLTLTNVTTNDTGLYTCTMTNECGTTITANLTINVSNLGTDSIENYKQQITLYPNPTKSSINLKFPENRGLKGLKYKITNLLGQTLQEQEITKINSKNELTLDTAGFNKGVYQLMLTTDKGDWNGKFVKE